MSSWIQHIKDFARQKGVSYACALSDPQCSISYQAKKLSNIRQKDFLASERKRIEIRQNRRKNLNQLKETTGMMKEDVNVAGRPRANTRLTEETYQERMAGGSKPNVVITGETKVIRRPKKKVVAEVPVASSQPAEVEPKKKAGRKSKYATEEEKKKAKREQTLASNKRRYYEKKMETDLKL